MDSDEEQALLEELIEGVKPPTGAPAGLHYLLFTPFRYPPLRHGSRFGTRAEHGIWYGSRTQATAFAEKAYYLLLFLEGTTAELAPLETDVSIYQAAYETRKGVDLTRGAFARYQALISSPSDYAASQTLGREMRADGVEAFLYASARDPDTGTSGSSCARPSRAARACPELALPGHARRGRGPLRTSSAPPPSRSRPRVRVDGRPRQPLE